MNLKIPTPVSTVKPSKSELQASKEKSKTRNQHRMNNETLSQKQDAHDQMMKNPAPLQYDPEDEQSSFKIPAGAGTANQNKKLSFNLTPSSTEKGGGGGTHTRARSSQLSLYDMYNKATKEMEGGQTLNRVKTKDNGKTIA